MLKFVKAVLMVRPLSLRRLGLEGMLGRKCKEGCSSQSCGEDGVVCSRPGYCNAA